MNYLRRLMRRIHINSRRVYYAYFYKNIDIGYNLNFRRNFEINTSKEANIKIGNNCFFNNECSLNAHKYICIGDNCIFGENVKVYDHNHIFRDYIKPIYTQGFKCKNVIIGNDCWIGSNSVILPGTKIGDKVIIGAGCVISGEIESGMIVTANRELQFKGRIQDDK